MEGEDYWRAVLLGEDKALKTMVRVLRSLPSAPRCKLCMAPFEGPVAPLLKVIGFRRWPLNQQMCRFCVTSMEKQRGGAEVPVSLLFADVRGSTALAETLPPRDYVRTMDRFFHLVARAVDAEQGVIDHIVGDGVMAMWIPAFVGGDHARHAVAAGKNLAARLRSSDTPGFFPAGVGVHTGVAYVGVVGEPGSYDFTVQGDVANTTARLGSAAAPGELVMSAAIAEEAGLDTGQLVHRRLDLKGKADPVAVWVDAPRGLDDGPAARRPPT
ncbi:MAG TPA: adenylate/guanylate cyclase domain-containing protein [Acidimicrobiia bacterium]|nr:adenylate/guanylate cyclase domain-containing protein [Acidimicrobiia bacterium]